MIIGVGIDLVSVARIEKLISKFGDRFAEKVFTVNEILKAEKIKIINSRTLFFAKRFAAKEAFSKAIGLGIGRGIDFIDIEVENNNFGTPKIKVINNKENFLKQHFGCNEFAIHLSLTDENPYAAAYVIIEKIS